MSLYQKLKGFKELEPIEEKDALHFQSGRSEGAPYLFYDFEEFCDLMGHGVTFYPNGVLLYIKDKNKDYETSRSFVFYNNDKLEVLKAHNRRSQYNPETRSTKYLPPIKDIEVKVYKDYIYIKETVFETNEIQERIIDVHTGEKLNDFVDGQQVSMDL